MFVIDIVDNDLYLSISTYHNIPQQMFVTDIVDND